MKTKNYNYILLCITATILVTIGLQIYLNIKSYGENKQQLINEVQIAFDNSVEQYYLKDLKFTTSVYTNESIPNKNKRIDKKLKDSIVKILEKYGKNLATNIAVKMPEIMIVDDAESLDSITKNKDFSNKDNAAIFRDSIEFKQLSRLLDNELSRKKIDISYGFEHFKANTLFQKYYKKPKSVTPLSTFSKSTYFPLNQKLKLNFSNPTTLILQKSMIQIILSLLLCLSIIACLLYLLKIINQQKKIDEMKNDLISNITHEFKTPITTVYTAIEGIKKFSDMNDHEKTNRYLDISVQQLSKLEILTEKILESSSIDADNRILKRESVDIITLLKNLIEKYSLICGNKDIIFNSKLDHLMISIDSFHLENAISNLIDNAIKYGGNTITISVNLNQYKIEIDIEDNGSGIEKNYREKIFDKFYRIPKGNIHDVKGFGIGLYYSRKIIEKHNGTLSLIINGSTVFKITLRYA